MSFYLRLSIAWLCLLGLLVIPACVARAYGSEKGEGEALRPSAVWCAPPVTMANGEVRRGPAWQERRACAGEATASCYQRLGDDATSDELTACMAPLIERCELAFRHTCRTGRNVASR